MTDAGLAIRPRQQLPQPHPCRPRAVLTPVKIVPDHLGPVGNRPVKCLPVHPEFDTVFAKPVGQVSLGLEWSDQIGSAFGFFGWRDMDVPAGPREKHGYSLPATRRLTRRIASSAAASPDMPSRNPHRPDTLP